MNHLSTFLQLKKNHTLELIAQIFEWHWFHSKSWMVYPKLKWQTFNNLLKRSVDPYGQAKSLLSYNK